MKLIRVWVVALLGLWAISGLSLGSARANGIGSDRIIVEVQGTTIADQTLSEGSEGGGAALVNIPTNINAGQFFIHQFDLVEPDGITFSDHVRAVADESTHLISIFFCSDQDDNTCLTFTGPNVIETGELQDVSAALGVDTFGITVMVQSDLSDLVRTPEPGTLLLFASGLAGVTGAAWRRNRRK